MEILENRVTQEMPLNGNPQMLNSLTASPYLDRTKTGMIGSSYMRVIHKIFETVQVTSDKVDPLTGTYIATFKHNLNGTYECYGRVRKRGESFWIPIYCNSQTLGYYTIYLNYVYVNVTDNVITATFNTNESGFADFELEFYFIEFKL